MQAIAEGRFIEGHAKGHVTCGGDGGGAVQGVSNVTRKTVRPMVAAKERNDNLAIVRHGNDWRFGGFIGQQRRDAADQNTGGANADYRGAGCEQIAGVVQRVGEECISLIHTVFAAMHWEIKGTRDGVGGWFAGSRQDEDDGGYSHGSAPLVRRIIEKYGAFSGASRSGVMICSGSVARST